MTFIRPCQIFIVFSSANVENCFVVSGSCILPDWGSQNVEEQDPSSFTLSERSLVDGITMDSF